MSKKISINLSDSQYDELKTAAATQGLSLAEIVISCLPITKAKGVTLSDIEKIVAGWPAGEFSLPKLFAKDTWQSFTVGSRLIAAKAFNKKVDSGGVPNVKYLRVTSANLAVYEKI